MGAIGAGEACGVFVKRARFVSEYSSDHVYKWSDFKTFQFIFQPFCLDPASCSNRVANSKSDSAFSRGSGKLGESYTDGSAQSVHSRAMLKLPRSDSRRINVSTPATRRFLSTSKRWPRRGWNG